MANLPGVKVGPLDPDSTSQFGQVNARNTARQLIRLHRQMFPPQKVRALSRPLDEARTKGLDYDEVEEYLRGQQHSNGDALLPDDHKLVGAAVHGDPRTGQVLTYQYETPSGRVGKWYAPYTDEALPISFDAGAELTKVKEMKDRGVVAFDSEGTRTAILERHNAELRRQVGALQKFVQGGSQGEAPTGAEVDTRNQATIADDAERLGRENVELKERLAQFEALHGAQGGGVPTAGIDETIAPTDSVASADEPFEGYDDLKATEVVTKLKADETTNEEREAILAYERTHANRGTVVSAAEQTLTSNVGGGDGDS